MRNSLRRSKKPKLLSRKRDGQGLTEYALILSLVAIVVIVILALLGPSVGNIYSNILAPFQSGGEGGPEPPPECYGSLLLPIMVGSTGLVAGISMLLPKKATTDQPA